GHALRLWRAMQPVLEVRADHRGRPLWTEDEAARLVQRDVVHLVLDDVASLARALLEDRAVLDDRCRDPGIAIPDRTRQHDGLKRVERGRVFWKEIPHAAGRLQVRHRRDDDTRIVVEDGSSFA